VNHFEASGCGSGVINCSSCVEIASGDGDGLGVDDVAIDVFRVEGGESGRNGTGGPSNSEREASRTASCESEIYDEVVASFPFNYGILYGGFKTWSKIVILAITITTAGIIR